MTTTTEQVSDPINQACDGCTAEARQPCTWGCLSNTHDSNTDDQD